MGRAGFEFFDSLKSESGWVGSLNHQPVVGRAGLPVLTALVTNPYLDNNESCYLDSECSNHMTGRRDWLINFDEKKKSIVRFVDNRVIQVEGTKNMLVT